jgi:hypothetical protein
MAASWELSGSVSEKDKSFIETWENVGVGVNYIIRENRRGDSEYAEVKGDRQFKLSTYDRMLTEDSIVDHRHNPFRNGSFRPIIVPEDVSIDSNPNAMSNDEIKSLFKASDTAWNEWMEQIDAPATLKRMIDMANNGEEDLSVRRLRQLESMYEQHSNVGRRVLGYKDEELNKLNKSSGSENEPVGATPPARGPGRPRKAATS